MSGGRTFVTITIFKPCPMCGKQDARVPFGSDMCKACLADNCEEVKCCQCREPLGYTMNNDNTMFCVSCFESLNEEDEEEEEKPKKTKKRSKK